MMLRLDTSPQPRHEHAPTHCNAALVSLRAADGYALTAIRYAPDGAARGHIVVAGAIGVPQRFYRRFAQFAAGAGYATLTFDYRGIARSAPPTLRGFRADCLDWGRLDLAAAVDAMSKPGVPLYVAGHSFGGQAFGMLPNHHRVNAVFAFGTGAGWHGWMPPLERVRVLALWHIVGPLLTRWKGYLPWRLLAMGEDLPLEAYRQWKRWCRYPNYLCGDPSMQRVACRYARVRTPMLAANAIDDRWSPPASRDAFMAGYRNAAWETHDIDPAHLGLPALGHMGYFREHALPLWSSALQWLDGHRHLPMAATAAAPARANAQRAA
jgi:predicted alpha/beta hydrolase